MGHSVYITGLGPGGGKSTVALGFAELLSRQVGRVGAFRPLVATPGQDAILSLLADRYQIRLPVQDLHGTTYAHAAALVADGRREELISLIVERYRAVERCCPALLVIGSDFAEPGEPGGGLPRELGFNVRLAAEFGSLVVPVVDGSDQDAESITALIRSAYHDFTDLGATVLAVVANRVPDDDVKLPALPVPAYAIPEVPTVSAPTVAEVAAALDAMLLAGDSDALGRDVLDFVVGAAHVPTLVEHLTDGCLVIMPGDRNDLLVASSAAHVAGQVSLAGFVLTLGEQPDPRAMRLVQQLNTGLAVLSVSTDSYTTIAASSHIEGRLSSANPRKVEAALGAFESSVDTAELARRLRVTRSTRVTPLMFEYELIDRARADRRRVVLPEGTDDRILRAAEILLRRGAAELILLGRPDEVRRRARELGLAIDAEIIDPTSSPWREPFAQEYADLRRHRGATLDLARDIVTDVNYFGTLMVHLGYADGMVSGATHTTASTLRPAFEIIKTLPGVSVASSVFFMLLADRVLVYGDCAVNPDPDADQLADIAISSADTAARFGIDPRIAMLSYSTGASGAGADVEKVAAARALVQARRPDLLVEGPIQYDAAIDPAVAATKLPGSAVAGRATVFIFPDLNTGNNTYKAVQRSAGAVAVGPVMQGLRRPVNDLSRGATVKDIVNTVAITAIQAAAATPALEVA